MVARLFCNSAMHGSMHRQPTSRSQVRPGEGSKAYDDLPVVRELRGLANRARLAGKVASRSSDETKKWLSWPDFLKVVQQLRCECAGARATSAALSSTGGRRLAACGFCPCGGMERRPGDPCGACAQV